jgi:hypothetical protein
MRIPGEVLILLVLYIICAVCGCLDAPASQPVAPPLGGGITPIDAYGLQQTFTLDQALEELDLFTAESGAHGSEPVIRQVLGANVDADGRATTWVLGVQEGTEVRWLAFGATGWRGITLRAPLPSGAVAIAGITPPEDLLSLQEGLLGPAMTQLGADTVDLALAEGRYTITIRSDSGMETYLFRAENGEVLVSD